MLAEARRLLADAHDEASRGRPPSGGDAQKRAGAASLRAAEAEARARAIQVKAETATVVTRVRAAVEEIQAQAVEVAQRTNRHAEEEAARILAAALAEAGEIQQRATADHPAGDSFDLRDWLTPATDSEREEPASEG